MNPTPTLTQLIETLLENDYEKECPFCTKEEWGEEKHDEICPFAIAYALREASKKEAAHE